MFGGTEPSAGPRTRGRGCGSTEGVLWSPARGRGGEGRSGFVGKSLALGEVG